MPTYNRGACACCLGREYSYSAVTYCNIPMEYIPNSTWTDGAGNVHQSFYSPYDATLDPDAEIGLTLYYSDGTSETIYANIDASYLDTAVGQTGIVSGGQIYFKSGLVIEHTDGYDYTVNAFSCMPQSSWNGPSDGNASVVADAVVHEGGATRTLRQQ